jgi:hypothetical protein
MCLLGVDGRWASAIAGLIETVPHYSPRCRLGRVDFLAVGEIELLVAGVIELNRAKEAKNLEK